MKIELTNQQTVRKINRKKLARYLQQLFLLLHIPSKKISFVLCNNTKIAQLNKKFFKKNTPTDVIAFPLKDDFEPNYLGEVIVSVEAAVRFAPQYGHGWQEELLLYMVHGVLHLIGYEDCTRIKRQRMEKRQERILKKLLLPIDLRD